MLHPNRHLVYSILLNIPISYHPMNLLPTLAPTSSNSNIANLLSKPLSCHRFDTLLGDIHYPTPLSASASLTATVDSATVDPVVASPTTTSDSVPTLQPNLALALTLPIVLDTGASFSISPSRSDFLPVAQAPYGLIRSALSVASKAYTSKLASTPVDPYTLITGEDISADPFDLSSPNTTIDSDSGPSSFGCLQTFTLFHLIPIWIYSLLHFGLE